MPPCLPLRSCELLQLYSCAFSAPVIIIAAGGSASPVLVAVFFHWLGENGPLSLPPPLPALFKKVLGPCLNLGGDMGLVHILGTLM